MYDWNVLTHPKSDHKARKLIAQLILISGASRNQGPGLDAGDGSLRQGACQPESGVFSK